MDAQSLEGLSYPNGGQSLNHAGLPTLLLIAIVWSYWMGVLLIVIRVRTKWGKPAGIVPEVFHNEYVRVPQTSRAIPWVLAPNHLRRQALAQSGLL